MSNPQQIVQEQSRKPRPKFPTSDSGSKRNVIEEILGPETEIKPFVKQKRTVAVVKILNQSARRRQRQSRLDIDSLYQIAFPQRNTQTQSNFNQLSSQATLKKSITATGKSGAAKSPGQKGTDSQSTLRDSRDSKISKPSGPCNELTFLEKAIEDMSTQRLINDTYKFIYDYQKDQNEQQHKRIFTIFKANPHNFNPMEFGLHLQKYRVDQMKKKALKDEYDRDQEELKKIEEQSVENLLKRFQGQIRLMAESEFANAENVLQKFSENKMAFYVHKLNKFFLTNDQLTEPTLDVAAISEEIELQDKLEDISLKIQMSPELSEKVMAEFHKEKNLVPSGQSGKDVMAVLIKFKTFAQFEKYLRQLTRLQLEIMIGMWGIGNWEHGKPGPYFMSLLKKTKLVYGPKWGTGFNWFYDMPNDLVELEFSDILALQNQQSAQISSSPTLEKQEVSVSSASPQLRDKQGSPQLRHRQASQLSDKKKGPSSNNNDSPGLNSTPGLQIVNEIEQPASRLREKRPTQPDASEFTNHQRQVYDRKPGTANANTGGRNKMKAFYSQTINQRGTNKTAHGDHTTTTFAGQNQATTINSGNSSDLKDLISSDPRSQKGFIEDVGVKPHSIPVTSWQGGRPNTQQNGTSNRRMRQQQLGQQRNVLHQQNSFGVQSVSPRNAEMRYGGQGSDTITTDYTGHVAGATTLEPTSKTGQVTGINKRRTITTTNMNMTPLQNRSSEIAPRPRLAPTFNKTPQNSHFQQHTGRADYLRLLSPAGSTSRGHHEEAEINRLSERNHPHLMIQEQQTGTSRDYKQHQQSPLQPKEPKHKWFQHHEALRSERAEYQKTDPKTILELAQSQTQKAISTCSIRQKLARRVERQKTKESIKHPLQKIPTIRMNGTVPKQAHSAKNQLHPNGHLLSSPVNSQQSIENRSPNSHNSCHQVGKATFINPGVTLQQKNKNIIKNIVSACYVSQGIPDPLSEENQISNQVRKTISKVPPMAPLPQFFKKLEIQKEIEERIQSNYELTDDFLKQIDADLDPKKVFALYFYMEGSHQQYIEMQREIMTKMNADALGQITQKLRLEKYIRKRKQT